LFSGTCPISRQCNILLGNGDGTFSISQPANTGHNPSAIATADLNGDGILDLIVMNDPDFNLTLLMGKGDGTFTPTTVSPLMATTHALWWLEISTATAIRHRRRRLYGQRCCNSS